MLRDRHYETINAGGRRCIDRVLAGTQRMSNLIDDLLEIALENLLDNAWKFTAGRPVAELRFGTVRPADERNEQRHGGRIWADAGVDRGATIYFTIAKGQQ